MKNGILCMLMFLAVTFVATGVTVALDYQDAVLKLCHVEPLGKFHDMIATVWFVYTGTGVAVAGVGTAAVMTYGSLMSRKWAYEL